MDTSRANFVGIDGGKALRAAVTQVFEHPVIQCCRLHKIRIVADELPDHLPSSTVTSRMCKAYHADSALAQAQLEALAKEVERTHFRRSRITARRSDRDLDRAAPQRLRPPSRARCAPTASSR
jgi:transposase-like protein